MKYLKKALFLTTIVSLMFLGACGGKKSPDDPNNGNNQPKPPLITPAFATTSIFPSIVPYNQTATVTVTSTFSQSTPANIELRQLKTDGSTSVIGQLLDGGVNGDKRAGDGTFTFQWNLTPTSPEYVRLRVFASTSGSTSIPVLSKELVVTVIADDQILPPDPGEEGKKTVEGIDSQNSGMRDDIWRYVADKYADSKPERAAATQTAVPWQQLINNIARQKIAMTSEEEEILVGDFRQLAAAWDCLRYVMMKNDADVTGGAKAYSAIQELKEKTLNTPQRVEAYLRAESQIGAMAGEIFVSRTHSEKASQCAMDLSALAN
jgi:hypothetical protein